MVDRKQVSDALAGVVGFEKPYDPAFDILAADLYATETGATFGQYSSYITVQNIKETQPYAAISNADFSAYIREKVASAIMKSINKCFQNGDLIQGDLLFKHAMRKTDRYLIAPKGNFVGYELHLSKRQDVRNIIKDVRLSFKGTGTITLLLLNSEQDAPVQQKKIEITSNDQTEVLNWEIPYRAGDWYIGYVNDGLTVQAYDREYESADVMTKFNCIRPESIEVPGWKMEGMFDIDEIEYVSETHGLNFYITTLQDYTDIVINNKAVFADVIGYQFAVDMVAMMATSPRINDIQRLQKGTLLAELEGIESDEPTPNIVGLHTRLAREIKRVRKSLKEPGKITKATLS